MEFLARPSVSVESKVPDVEMTDASNPAATGSASITPPDSASTTAQSDPAVPAAAATSTVSESLDPDHDYITLQPHNGFQRLLVYQMVQNEFADAGIDVVKVANPNPQSRPYMMLRRMTPEQVRSRQEEARVKARADLEAQLRDQIGLRHVVDAICAAKKPVP